jgi:general stress protein CsbA
MDFYLLNFILNKFCPYLAILGLLIITIGDSAPLCYLILPFIVFIDRHSFKTGYSVAYCKINNIDLNNPPNK